MNRNRLLMSLMAIASMIGAAPSYADNVWSAQNYDLYPGDFNGDGLTDLLYISRDARFANGIVLSDGAGFGTTYQSWGNAYLGIPWNTGTYNFIIADFNGDGKADVLAQPKAPGDSYLILGETNGLGGIAQTIGSLSSGLRWSADAHRLIAGDFDGDGKADLFFQATDANGTNAVLLTDSNGLFTARAPSQSWADGTFGFKWAASEGNVFASDFNGDGLSDLLVQEVPATPGAYTPNGNGIVAADRTTKRFALAGVQAWNHDGLGAEWAPVYSAVTVGDFDGDGKADVLLQSTTGSQPSSLLFGHAPGAILVSATALSASVTPSADKFRVVAGRFDGGKSAGLYLQSRSATSDNYLARAAKGVLTVATANPPVMSTSPGGAMPQASSSAASGVAVAAAATLTVTSAGRTEGKLSVSAQGAATYQVPLWTPPGASGIEPHLALVYTSSGRDSSMGPGWAMSGLSSIARCVRTIADNGGVAGGVTLTAADDFCVDGNRLRATTATNPKCTGNTNGAVYYSEIANFSRVTACGTAGTGPSYFIVENKDGLIYEYGNTADSKAYTSTGTTPYAWLLNKVRDREASANNMIITYSAVSGYVQPSSIQYTQTPSTNGTTYPYTVTFTYKPRVTHLQYYIAGGAVTQTQVLGNINVKSGATSVRQYYLNYTTSSATLRDRLDTIQECGGSAGTDCLRPSTFIYQDGQSGVNAPTTSTGSGAASGYMRSVDIDGDGRADLIFSTVSNFVAHYYVQFATATGYGPVKDTTIVTPSSWPLLLDDYLANGKTELIAVNGSAWSAYQYNGSTFVSSPISVPLPNCSVPQAAAVADGDGDGKPDMWIATGCGNSPVLKFYKNTSTTSAIGFSTTPITRAYSGGFSQFVIRGDNDYPNSSVNHVDISGDGVPEIVAGYLYTTPTGGQKFFNGIQISGNAIVDTGGSVVAIDNMIPVNWNNDTCTDFLDYLTTPYVIIEPCNGSNNGGAYTLTAGATLATDWDGDGHTDSLYVSGGVWQVQRSLGDGVAAPVSTGISAGSGSWAVTDGDGDGLSDLLFSDSSASGAIKFGAHKGAATQPDLATSFTDGWGIGATVNYVPITQGNYSGGVGASYPDYDYNAPIYVVGTSHPSDGLGGSYALTYNYFGSVMNVLGRGWKGFQQMYYQDSRNGVVYITRYRQDFPYIGAVDFQRLQQSGGSNVSNTQYAYATLDIAGVGCAESTTNANTRCFPYVQTSTTTNYEVSSGTPLVDTRVQQFTYDTYGNVLTNNISVTDNDPASPNSGVTWSSNVTNTYASIDPTNWCVTYATHTLTQNAISNQGAVPPRTVDHGVDTAKCRYSSLTIEPSSLTLKAVTTLSYDTCGNLKQIDVNGLDKSGAPMTTRTSTADYGTRCTFPENTKDPVGFALGAAGYRTHITYDYNLGVELSRAVQSADGLTNNAPAFLWQYDNFGRPTVETRPDSTTSTWVYTDCTVTTCFGISDNLRLQIARTDKDSAAVVIKSGSQYVDGLNRVKYVSEYRALGTLTWTQRQFDSLGRVAKDYQPYSPLGTGNNGVHLYSYDLVNRQTRDDLYNNNATPTLDRTRKVDYAGLKSTVSDLNESGALLTSKTQWQDVTGSLQQVVDPSPGGTTRFAYDPYGNLTDIYDPGSAHAQYSYNVRGFQTQSNDPDSGISTYTPDSLNELVELRTAVEAAQSKVTSFGYDLLGRLTSRTDPDYGAPTNWTFGTTAANHDIGSLTGATQADGYSESYQFDNVSRPKFATYTIPEGPSQTYTYGFTYNSIGALDVLTYPTSSTGFQFQVKYAYSNGDVSQVKDNQAGTVFWSLQGLNDYLSPTAESLGNSVQVNSTYKPWTNELQTRNAVFNAATTIQNLSYQWDKLGNLSQRNDLIQSLTENFVPDALNRLSSSTVVGSPAVTYTYSANGNVSNRNDVGSYDYTTAQAGCSYQSYTQPHAVRKAGSAVYCYDANGNAVSRNGSPISWTTFNLPSVINSGSNSTSFSYGPDRQRYKQSANYGGTSELIYYVGGLLEKVKQGANQAEFRHQILAGTQRIIYNRKADGTSATYYVSSDHLGSSDLVMNTSGLASTVVMAKESFQPYGARRGSNWLGVPSAPDYVVFSQTTRRGFTDHVMLDSVGLIHMNGRVYDPTIGRFMSADPLVGDMADSQSVNPYAYVSNNPLASTDPSGLASTWDTPINPPSDNDWYSPFHLCFFMGNCWSDAGWLPGIVTQFRVQVSGPPQIPERRSDTRATVTPTPTYQQSGSSFSMSGLWRKVSHLLLPSITEAGERGVPGSAADSWRGAGKELLNTVLDLASLAPGAREIDSILGNPRATISDTEISGAAKMEGVIWIAGAVGGLSRPAASVMSRIGRTVARTPTKALAARAGAAEVRAARAAPDFVVTPKGEAIRVPTGATGPTPTRAPGVQYTGGAGGKGLDSRVTGVRVMEGNANQGPRAVYMNRSGQTVNPATGRTVPNADPAAHQYLEPWP